MADTPNTPTPDESARPDEQAGAFASESSASAASPTLADQIRQDNSEKKLHRLFFFTMGAGAAALATAGAFHAFSDNDGDNADVAAPETSVTQPTQSESNKTTVTETTTVTPSTHPDAPGASSARGGEPQRDNAMGRMGGNAAEEARDYANGAEGATGGAGVDTPGYPSDSSAATPERGSAQTTGVYGAPQVGGVYIIAPGDTLSGISATTNVTIDALVRANGIADPNLIYAYAPLQIPGREGY